MATAHAALGIRRKNLRDHLATLHHWRLLVSYLLHLPDRKGPHARLKDGDGKLYPIVASPHAGKTLWRLGGLGTRDSAQIEAIDIA